MEKLKDILYDLSDVIISLVIIAVIFGVVSWKLNDTLPLTSTLFSGDQSNQNEASAVASETTAEVTVNITMPDSANTPQDQNQTQSTESIETTAALATEPGVVKKQITIRSGSSGNAIAKQLKQAGIIEDANAFLKVVADLGVGGRLQIGTFSLSSDMSYEEIALILSGRR